MTPKLEVDRSYLGDVSEAEKRQIDSEIEILAAIEIDLSPARTSLLTDPKVNLREIRVERWGEREDSVFGYTVKDYFIDEKSGAHLLGKPQRYTSKNLGVIKPSG